MDAKDFPFELMCEQAQEQIKQGTTIHQKFTCSGCGARLFIEKPNVFYEEATCDKCAAITNIKKAGCNYSVIMAITVGPPEDIINKQQSGASDGAKEQSQSNDTDPDRKHSGHSDVS
jgi:hypothetical protein